MPDVDYVSVAVKVNCPVCGSILGNFETKEGPGVGGTLNFREVDSFYSRCGKCNSIIEFTLRNSEEARERTQLTIESYNRKSVLY